MLLQLQQVTKHRTAYDHILGIEKDKKEPFYVHFQNSLPNSIK
jgi:hypothetical protein